MYRLLSEVLSRIKPTEEEMKKIRRVMEKVRSLLLSMEDFSFDDVVFAGSAARGTNLRGSSDVDAFLLYSKEIPKKTIETEIKEMSRKLGGEMRYAQHPYFKINMEGIEVEVVPAYKINPGERPLSATDRTPLHNEYVLRHLPPEKRDDVRLLKAFLKGIGVYGAEIKVEGFSGYLCELLVIKYGGFLDVLKAVSHWRWGEYIDIEGHGAVKEKRPLIVVDPVDPRRNVAHTVSKESMALFIVASREFFRNPSLKFFFPSDPKLSRTEIKEVLRIRGSRLVAVIIPYPDDAPDNVWGQLKRLKRLLNKRLSSRGNFILQDLVWTDEKERAVIVMEIVGRYTARIKVREGPPVTDIVNSEKFIEKHKNDMFGPFIVGGRLYAFYEEEEKSLVTEVFEEVEKIAMEGSVGGGIGVSLTKGFRVVEGREVLSLLPNDVITRFLLRKFPWEY